MNQHYDFLVIGAGIVGLTTAYELTAQYPHSKIAVIDKEPILGLHASGRNSGVLHCGIYYGSDTLKARFCASGANMMMDFATEHGITFNKCGKIILATCDEQLPTVDRLIKNAHENNIKAEKISATQLREIEPNAAKGTAIYCPDTAVIDSKSVLHRLHLLLTEKNVHILLDHKFLDRKNDNTISTDKGEIEYGFLINCAGAFADKIAKKYELSHNYALVPFKGIYWKLTAEANHMVHANIYPVPDIKLPFLGVHLTRVINGDVYIGPTAIPALGRENYGMIKGINAKEAITVGNQLLDMYWRNQNNFRFLVHSEIKKYSKSYFLNAARKLMPALKAEHLLPTTKSGIRPQLVNLNSGKLEMDYIFESTHNSLHVLNAISPAFTSSLSFAKEIVNRTKHTI